MRQSLKSGAAALMLLCMSQNVWAAAAAPGCARPEDFNAIKAAAVQQMLMVAALSCDAVQAYNDFVKGYQKELQNSDRALQTFFRRLNGNSGTGKYHAFKTQLANASSMQSIANITIYCASAKETFDAASANKSTLAVFLAEQSTPADSAFSPCQLRTTEIAYAAAPPESIPLPLAKPVASVLQGQGAGLPPPRLIEMRAMTRLIEMRAMNGN